MQKSVEPPDRKLIHIGKARIEPEEMESYHPKIRGRELELTVPNDGAHVPYRPLVEGRVSDPDAQVWVVVHPMEVSDYWIQPPVSVREAGNWKVQVYIGRPGRIDVGKSFEIMAVANADIVVREATVLSFWPEAKWHSQVIEVIRA